MQRRRSAGPLRWHAAWRGSAALLSMQRGSRRRSSPGARRSRRLGLRPADDLLVGRLIAEQGYEVTLLPYTIQTVADYGSFGELLHKRLRWIVVMRNLRPAGHFGLIFTLGLAWTLAAIASHPTAPVILGFVSAYLLLRVVMTAIIAAWGLKQPGSLKNVWLIPVWDAVACAIWLVSFSRNSIRWRGADYYIREGQLVPVAASPEAHREAA